MTRHADRKLLLADIRARSMAASAGEQIDAAQEEQCAEAAPASTSKSLRASAGCALSAVSAP